MPVTQTLPPGGRPSNLELFVCQRVSAELQPHDPKKYPDKTNDPSKLHLVTSTTMADVDGDGDTRVGRDDPPREDHRTYTRPSPRE